MLLQYLLALFTDWCAALEVVPVPADPLVVAEFLADHPAAAATQVRRVSAINHAHRRTGHGAPGTVPAVRAALQELSERDRTILLMREEGFRYAEIADAIGVKHTSVGALVARALRRFSAAWAALDGTDGTSD